MRDFLFFFFVLHVLCALRTIHIPARARYAHCLLLGVDTLKRFTVTRLVEKLQRNGIEKHLIREILCYFIINCYLFS